MKTAGPAPPDGRIDLPILDPAYKADPYRLYARWRRQGRVVVPIRLPTGVEAWLVTGFAEARALLADPRLSKCAPRAAPDQPHALYRHLLSVDPPEHTRLRAIIAREFSPRRIERLRPRIRALAGELLDAATVDGRADLMAAYAVPLPLRVICELVGVPAADVARVHRWSVELADEDEADGRRVWDVAQELQDYLDGLASAKQRVPDDSLLSALAAAQLRDELSGREVASMAFLLLMAGHETTAHLVGNSVVALLRNRSQWDALVADPALAKDAVEELLRIDSPLEVSTARYATTEIAIAGVRIQPRDMVFIGLAAANRDPGHFVDPDRLDIGRRPVANHLAFGHGVHYCAGAALARAEGEVALVELARRFPRLALAVPAERLEWAPGLIMRGLTRLPVCFDARIGATT
jgi:cytochrome P450